IPDVFRRSFKKHISGTPILGRMHREHGAMIGATLLDPHHGVGRKPVVSVHHVEVTDVVFRLEEMPNERPAHFLDLLHENAVQTERAVMIPDTVDLVRASGPVAGPGKDMQLMSPALE